MTNLFRLALSLLMVAWVSAGAAAEPSGPTRITVLHTNDHHGRFWKNASGEYGLAARNTLIDRIRAEVRAQGGYTLVLDGGDVNTGTPASDMQNAEPDFLGMSMIGYDAMTVGNHEFDKTPDVLRQQQSWSNFPWLSANIYKDGKRPFEPYHILKLGKAWVGVVGLTTQDTAKMLSAERHPGIVFRSPIEEARDLIPKLKKKADVIIVLTHMGHYPDGKHGVNAPGDVELARAVPGIHLIVGGHTHTLLCVLQENVRNDAYEPGGNCAPDRQNGAWIVQAGDWGRFVGRADFEYVAGEFRLKRYTLIPVNLRRMVRTAEGEQPGAFYSTQIPEDPRLVAALRPFQERGLEKLSVAVGKSNGKFDGTRLNVRSRQTNLGTLITRAMLEKTKADFALISGGGIRDSLPAGPLTYGDLLRVQPFGNQIVTVTMTGAEVLEYMRVVAKMTPGSGAYPQYSGLGMASAGKDLKLTIAGTPLQPDKSYRMTLSSFLAKGGDGYPVLVSHPGFVNTGFVDAEVLREFISQRPLLRVEDFEPDGAVTTR